MTTEFEDFGDTMCNMSDIDDSKSIASTIDDFIERTPTNRISIFREKIDKMRHSKWIQLLIILFIVSLVYSLFHWDNTKQILYTYYAKLHSNIQFFRLISDT